MTMVITTVTTMAVVIKFTRTITVGKDVVIVADVGMVLVVVVMMVVVTVAKTSSMMVVVDCQEHVGSLITIYMISVCQV